MKITAYLSSSDSITKKGMHFSPMREEDVQEVLAIESAVFPYPWVYANFASSIAHDHDAWVMREENDTIAGYFVSMNIIDETHLLTIAVRPDLHGQGFGRILLNKALLMANKAGMASILLEVRPSNIKARKLYEEYGFTLIGVRKNYYPADNQTKEDALVMRLEL